MQSERGEPEWGAFWKLHIPEGPRAALIHDWNGSNRTTGAWAFTKPVRVGQVFSVECEDMLALAIVTALDDENGRVTWRPLVIAYDDPDEDHQYALWVERGTYLIGSHVDEVIAATRVPLSGTQEPPSKT